MQPPPPSPPEPVLAPSPDVLVGVPTTRREMAALRDRRTELSRQLTSASERRDELVGELREADAATRSGIEARVGLLDQRILRLESELSETGRLVVAGAGRVATVEAPRLPGTDNRVDVTAIAIVFTLAVFLPIALAVARMIWKRTTSPRQVSAAAPEDSQRLMRLEQAVDTIAVEVERISEGQRFVTQLLADGAQQGRILEGVPGRER